MKELIEAAVAAAGKAGLRTAVVVVDGVAPAVEMPMGVAVSSGSDPVVADLEERIKGLKDELEEARKAPAPTPATDEEMAQLRSTLRASEAKEKELIGQIEEMKAAMEGLKAAPEQPATPPWEAPPMEQEETPAFDTQDVSFLGLEKKVERAVKRAGCNTIGELKVRFLADTTEARDGFRKDAKLTKDQMIAIGVQLAGKAPSPGVVGVPATAPTPPAETAAPAGGGATDVPGGHSDRPWLERYQATRTKAIRMVSSEKKVEELREAAAGDHPDAVVNGSLDLSKLPEDVAEAIRVEESTYNVVRGQVIAGIWHCGLDPTAGTLDAALERAGIDMAKLPGALAPVS